MTRKAVLVLAICVFASIFGISASPQSRTPAYCNIGDENCTATAGGAFSGGLGTSYQDVAGITAPANPASGNSRVYFDSSSGLLSCLTSAGGSCMPSGGTPSFSAITAGTNTAALLVGTGGSLGTSGSGTINASAVGGITITGTPSANQIPIATSGTAAQWGDPLVQGTQADASTTKPNPVLGGVWDGTNLRALLGDSSGRQTVNINGTVPVSGTFWQATQPVSIATMPTTPVTGTFWQTTQPVSIATMPSTPVAGTQAAGSTTLPNPVGVGGSDYGGTPALRALKVDSSGFITANVNGTVPVSGTFWQATQPISAATLPLPTGAATAAKQPALGTAGSPSADVITVQGIASMTALKVDGSAVTQPVSGTVTANAGTGTMTVTGVCNASAPISTSSSGDTQLVALVSGKTIYVCGYNVMAGGTTNVQLEYGTGTACGTGKTALTGAYPLIAQTGVSYGSGVGAVMQTAASNALCINNSAAIAIAGIVTYGQF